MRKSTLGAVALLAFVCLFVDGQAFYPFAPSYSQVPSVNGTFTTISIVGTAPSSTDPFTIIGNTNSYLELFIQNKNGGTNASTDIWIGNDKSSLTDTNYGMDLGINSSTYNGTIVGTNGDGYLYGGLFVTNVYLGTLATNGHVKIFVGGQYPTNTVDDYTTNGVVITGNYSLTGTLSGNGSGLTNIPALGMNPILTNALSTVVNLGGLRGNFQTNAAFTWLGFTNKSAVAYQSVTIRVFNSTGAGILMTMPANVNVVGSGSLYVTNYSDVLFDYDPSIPQTNVYVAPIR